MERSERNDAELLEAKKKLYHLLLGMKNEVFTSNEVELAYHLALDEQIQKFLGQHLKSDTDRRA